MVSHCSNPPPCPGFQAWFILDRNGISGVGLGLVISIRGRWSLLSGCVFAVYLVVGCEMWPSWGSGEEGRIYDDTNNHLDLELGGV